MQYLRELLGTAGYRSHFRRQWTLCRGGIRTLVDDTLDTDAPIGPIHATP